MIRMDESDGQWWRILIKCLTKHSITSLDMERRRRGRETVMRQTDDQDSDKSNHRNHDREGCGKQKSFSPTTERKNGNYDDKLMISK